ncbi:MAG: thioredoxin [Proteobacteria bacterium]|nr:thioredoxin [Pseudomonadota bacterium]
MTSLDARNRPHVFDATVAGFEADVLQASIKTPVLIDFWATWCGPCKTLGPILEKLASEYNGAFQLAKVDVDKEQELGAAFQIRSIPTVILVKGGQPVDGFQGALPEGQVRQFLKQHGIEPAAAPAPEPAMEVPATALDPQAEVARLRAAVAADPKAEALKLDLALALLKTGATAEAEHILDALPANLATDDRSLRARAHLGFAALLKDAPSVAALEAVVAANPADLHARHLLGTQHLLEGRAAAGLDQFIDMLRRNRSYADGLPRRALIDAFRVVEDADLVGSYRRKMASLLF